MLSRIFLLNGAALLGGLLIATRLFGASAAPLSALPLEEVLWREVHDQDGRVLGNATDVLVQMPSGQVIFILVRPTAIYSEPRAIPPKLLTIPEEPKSALTLDIKPDQWLNAPRLDWDPKRIVKHSENGAEIYAFYNQQWLFAAPAEPSSGVEVVASRPKEGSTRDAPQFVSLNNLLLHRVATKAWEQEGFVRGFLVDWPNQRATHAIVSQAFTVAPAAGEDWFAIPLSLLSPPIEHESIVVNVDPDAFVQAQRFSPGQATGNSSRIALYPASAVTGFTAAPGSPGAGEENNPRAAE